MASGDTLCVFHPYQNEPRVDGAGVSAAMRLAWRNQQPVLVAPDTLDNYAIFSGILPRWYAGGGITVTVWVATATATSNNASLGFYIERRNTDADSDSWTTVDAMTLSAVNGTAGIPFAITDAYTSGAQMDSLAAGEPFRIQLVRYPLNAGDTHSGDLHLLAVEIRET